MVTGGLVAVAAQGSAQGKGLEFLRSLLQREGVLAPQLTQQSSGRSGGGTVFGPTLARQVLRMWPPYKLVARHFFVTRGTR